VRSEDFHADQFSKTVTKLSQGEVVKRLVIDFNARQINFHATTSKVLNSNIPYKFRLQIG
jgi:hypothetical protein